MSEIERLVRLVQSAPPRLRKQAEAALIAGLAAGIAAKARRNRAKPRQERLPLAMPDELPLKTPQRSQVKASESKGRASVSPARRPAKVRATAKPKAPKKATSGPKSGGQPRPPAPTAQVSATTGRPRKAKAGKTRERAAARSKPLFQKDDIVRVKPEYSSGPNIPSRVMSRVYDRERSAWRYFTRRPGQKEEGLAHEDRIELVPFKTVPALPAKASTRERAANAAKIIQLSAANEEPKIYKVVGPQGTQILDKPALLRRYTQRGTADRASLRSEIRGEPTFRELAGPMYDGDQHGTPIVRYESAAVHAELSDLPRPVPFKALPPAPMRSRAKCGTPAEHNRTTIITPQGRDPAHYAIRPASSLIPSHDPQSFTPDPRYPAGVQERDYLHDENEQRKVIVGSQNIDPTILLHRAPTPADGPPLVTEDNCALGGNGRSLMLKRAFSEGGPSATRYRDELTCRAEEFGLDPRDVEQLPDPVLVRIVEGTHCDDPPSVLARKVRQYNNALTNALDDTALGVSLSRQLSPSTLSSFGDLLASSDSSLREKMREDPRAFARLLEADGVISNQNRSEYLTSSGGLTENAKDKIEAMFLGRALGSAERIRATPPALLRKLERAVPYVARVAARNPTYDVTPTLTQAVDLVNDAAGRGLGLEDVLSQRSLFAGASSGPDEATRSMARMLSGEGPVAVGQRFKNYANAADFDPTQPRMFGEKPPSPAEALAALSTSKPQKGRALYRGGVVRQPEGLARILSSGDGKVTIEYMTGAQRGQSRTLAPELVGEVQG
jgi:hypothetical protein